MTTQTRWLVITTIQPPTDQVRSLADLSSTWNLVSVGDSKTPRDWESPGFLHLTLEEQLQMDSSYASAAPLGHYCRKNLGYVLAIRAGAEMIAETDDDNAPLDGFLEELDETVEADVYTDAGWLNVYALAGHATAWPRGYPLALLRADAARAADPAQAILRPSAARSIRCPVQQYLVNGDADYDAVYRLTYGQPADFDTRVVALGPGSLSPFNSQATVWWPEAYPLLYLPSTVSFRATDIIRSYVAQVCLHAAGLGVAYLGPGMFQDRNPHNLMSDFESEVSIYLHCQKLVDRLRALDLPSDPTRMAESIGRCYEALADMDIVQGSELDLLSAWLGDIR